MNDLASAGSVARQALQSDGARKAARLGFVARGVVYMLIGVVAFRLATQRTTGESADREGALAQLADAPFGSVLLVAVAIGLAGYGLWRFTEALWGKTEETDRKKRTLKRLGSAVKGVVYASFAATTVSFLKGTPSRSSGGPSRGGSTQEKEWTARFLGWPGGRVVVFGLGLGIIVGGGYLLYRGFTRKFEKHLAVERMSASTKRLCAVLGTVGVSARGIVFGFIGALLVKAAVEFDPNEAEGLDGTLRRIASRPYGTVILLLAAVGLLAFGAFSFVEARFRQL